jgi:thymidylate kinase
MVADTHNTVLFVVFGIPGAGKTTIANHVVQKLLSATIASDSMNDGATTTATSATEIPQNGFHGVLDLDLDDCVPEWMRLNFANGIYPTLQQRNEFALSCCNYVNKSIQKFKAVSSISNGTSSNMIIDQLPLVIVVSFSFVNDDLRIHFRNQFPNSHWILIHTSEVEAQRRIQQRSNHFYKGKPPNRPSDSNDESVQQQSNTSSGDNNEWNFAPVTFPHTVINGHHPIEETSSEIVELIRTTIRSASMANDD